ncbi:hypothetical protein PMAYCL1PPCAC_12524, partial [Pristionchus mayeri]
MSGGSQKTIFDFIPGKVKRNPVVLFESPASVSKKRRISRELVGQTALDAGQARIGAQRCEKCEMVYSLDVEADVAEHKNFCSGAERRKSLVVERRTLDGWVKKVLSLHKGHPTYPETGTCVVVLKVERGCSVDNLKEKVEEVVRNQVNVSLGYTEEGSMWDTTLSSSYSCLTPSTSTLPSNTPYSRISPYVRPQRKAYMAVARDEKGICSIAGVVLAEVVSRAIDVDGEKMVRADKLMGVNRLWVNEEMRGRGIAKTMVDVARESFYSLAIPRSRVVFSEPTKDGERFARSYVKDGEGRLLVYNLGNGEKWKEMMKNAFDMRRRSQPITV